MLYHFSRYGRSCVPSCVSSSYCISVLLMSEMVTVAFQIYKDDCFFSLSFCKMDETLFCE